MADVAELNSSAVVPAIARFFDHFSPKAAFWCRANDHLAAAATGAYSVGRGRLNDHCVVSACPFQNGRDIIVRDHGGSACKRPLRADNCTQIDFVPFRQILKQNHHFAFIGQRVEQEVVQD